MSSNPEFKIKLKLLENYLFQIDFGEFGNLLVDEPPPLGEGEGPNPSALLAASVANCLSASLLFAIRKYKEDPGSIVAEISGQLERDENNRLRIYKMSVDIHLASEVKHIERAMAQFENFCIVTQSVRNGIEVDVRVLTKDGKRVYP